MKYSEKANVVDVQAALNSCDDDSNENKIQDIDDATDGIMNPDNFVENELENENDSTNGVSKLFCEGYNNGRSDEGEDDVSLLTEIQIDRKNNDEIEKNNGDSENKEKFENENGDKIENENKEKFENKNGKKIENESKQKNENVNDVNNFSEEIKIIQIIPAPPPIPRIGKSPKIVITEKNLKNGHSDVRKSSNIRKDDVEIISENLAGSFNDVETSAAILNDIKPSKFGLLSKLLAGPEINNK